jgi:hypothetical protein
VFDSELNTSSSRPIIFSSTVKKRSEILQNSTKLNASLLTTGERSREVSTRACVRINKRRSESWSRKWNFAILYLEFAGNKRFFTRSESVGLTPGQNL